ncbi:hypothetical protein [Natronolimnobius baerhuensis]|uniref:Uncharacterized protein n=1 Tax=Natronolimnobius baerhuensis TaxID=253108 RepID=A0A202E4S9_9EURY|nr:hypothetical protein [Natronolimnobius baerhuensis]OVE83214.1 hypothetical protein B2G88_17575 [Natronolimnobius baerhuensis]
MMYERTFGTDWEHLENRDEILWRAFALGVAECLGADHPDELERLADETETTYDRSFTELAYQKGRQRVRQLEGKGSAQIWQEVVEEQSELDLWAEPESTVDPTTDGEDETGLPDSLQGFRADTLPADSTERVQRPTFLERESPKRRRHRAIRESVSRSLSGDSSDSDESDDGSE